MAAAFLYGIGAAKAGTSWFAQALRAHPQAALPPAKETHYFDSLEFGSSMWSMDQMMTLRARKRAAMARMQNDAKRRAAAQWVQMLDRWIALIGAQTQDDQGYVALMQRRARGDVRVVADITPAYALLSEQTLARMAALNDGHTKFLMILRDPVDRLWSNIGMTLARRAAKGVDATAARNALMAEVLSDDANSPEIARSDYAATLTRLHAAVPEDRRLVLFFEELFAPETLGRVADFLGFDTALTGPNQRINAGSGIQITPDERARLAERLRPQYDDIQTRMGRLPDRWHETLRTSMVAS